MQVITKESHPLLCDAFETIDHDSGRHNRLTKMPTEYEVPLEFDVDKMEKALAKLTPDERETLAIGEQAEMMGLWRTKPELEEIHFMFSAYFTDWSDWRSARGLEQVQEAAGMTLEEAKKIASEGEHATITYDLAQKILVEAGEYQLAFYVGEMAQAQRKLDEAKAEFAAWRDKARNPKVATATGTKDDIKIIVDGCDGIYSPRIFCSKFSFEDFTGTISREDWEAVKAGPLPDGDDDYWDAWANIENSAEIILNPETLVYDDKRAILYKVYQIDGDIFLIPKDIPFDDLSDLFA